MKHRLAYLSPVVLLTLALLLGGSCALRGPGPPPTAPPSSPTAPPYPPPALPAAPRPPALTGDAPRLVASATHPGYAWIVEAVDGQPWTGAGTSLALDAQGFPHIAYNQSDGCDLRYARFDGARWLTETVDAFGLTGIDPSLALDAQGHPHVSYRIAGDDMDLQYAYHDGTRWYSETVDGWGDTGSESSLELDTAGQPHVAYHNWGGCVMYPWYDGTEWQIGMVDCGTHWYGSYTSLALDGAGRPHISCQSGYDTADLMYAWQDGTALRQGFDKLNPAAQGNAWQIEVVESQGNLGYYTSLELDAQGRPRISYYDEGNGCLRYAWHDGSEWHIEVVDDTGDVGQYTSLALDAQDLPHVSYFDYTNEDLRYARFDGARWLTETVDGGPGSAGAHTSLVLDGQGHPHISYFGTSSDWWWTRHLCYAHLVELPYQVFMVRVEK